MTSAAVRLVLVEGASGEGATIDHDEFDVATVREVAEASPPEHVAAAVSGTESIAAAGDHHLLSVGLTWTYDAESDAALVLELLADAGIHNVVAVPAVDATRALAAGIAALVECEAVAVCVVEPDEVMLAKTRHGEVVDNIDIVVNPGDPRAVARWLQAAMNTPDWRPERVFIVGSADNLGVIAAQLDAMVKPAVVSAAEAELALARGAALTAARAGVTSAETWILADDVDSVAEVAPRIARLAAMQEPLGFDDAPVDVTDVAEAGVPPKVRALTTVFVAAVLTFVVSLSVAVGLRLTPDHKTSTASPREMANAAAEPTMAPRALSATPPGAPPALAPEAPALPAADPVVAPPPEASPPSGPPIEAPDAAQLEVPVSAPVADPPAGEPPAAAPVAPVPPPAALPPVPPAQTPESELPPKHPLLSRIPIINRIPGVRGPALPDQVQQDPGVVMPAPAPDPPQ